MSEILIRIKRAVLAGNYAFSEKARIEMEADSLTELDVAESISQQTGDSAFPGAGGTVNCDDNAIRT